MNNLTHITVAAPREFLFVFSSAQSKGLLVLMEF
jgi:hypothetical protein